MEELLRNVKRKRVPGGSYSKTTRTEACTDMWDSQQTTVWWTKSTRRSVLFQYRVKISRLSSRDSFVSDAGDLKLDARLDRQPMWLFQKTTNEFVDRHLHGTPDDYSGSGVLCTLKTGDVARWRAIIGSVHIKIASGVSVHYMSVWEGRVCNRDGIEPSLYGFGSVGVLLSL